MISTPKEAVQSAYLLALFQQDMVNKLTTIALDAIKPQVMEAARAVVKEMEPQVIKQFDELKQETVFNLVVKEVK